MYWIMGLIGLGLLAAPYLMGYLGNELASWATWASGALLIILTALERFANDQEDWEYWAAGIMGILAIAAPFFLGFTGQASAMWSSIVSGLLLLGVAGSRVYTKEFRAM